MADQKCEVEGCDRIGHHTGKYDRNGNPIRRKVCYKHHVEACALRRCMTSTEWRNSFHPYLKYRKTYCENIDGRLGEKCTSTIHWPGMLHVDHIDGNHDNDDPENLQTLCANCHSWKTNQEMDWENRKAYDKWEGNP